MLTPENLHRYQQDTITDLYEHSRRLAILPMGAGKTASALTAFTELRAAGEVRKALVVAPKRVAQLVWPNEVRSWSHLQNLTVGVGLGPATKRRKMLHWDRADVVVQTIDNLQWLVEELAPLPDDHPLFDLLILDESSRLKNPRSKRAKALFKIIRRFRNVWFLTGTPRPNGITDLFQPMKLLSGGKLWGTSYDRWLRQYFIPDYNGYKWEVIHERLPWLEEDARRYCFTIDPDDMPGLPELVVRDVPVPMPAGTADEYERMAKEFIAWTEQADGPTLALTAAVRMGKLEQLAQGFVYHNEHAGEAGDYTRFDTEKLDRLEELVEGAGGEPVLICYWFAAELEELQRRFPDFAYIGAGVSDARVAQLERQWNRGQLPVMGLHPASAGHGLNLQQGGNQMIWLSPIWSAELWDQTLKRIHRQGQRRRCFVHRLVSVDAPLIDVDATKIMRVEHKGREQELFVRSVRRGA